MIPYQLSAAEVLEDKVELSRRLEGVDEVDDEGVLHLLKDVPLGLEGKGVFKYDVCAECSR